MQTLKVSPVMFYIADKRKVASMAVPTIDEISIIKGQKIEKRIIRYCVGERFIYKDEQSENAKQAKSVVFREGVLTLSPYESTLLEYLRTSDYNGSNPNRNPNKDILFYEYQPEIRATKSLNEEREEVEARSKVFQLKLEEVKAFCSATGMQNVDTLSEDEMRHSILLYAKSKPKEFVASINDLPTMKRKYNINTALQLRMIEKRGQSVFFKNGDLLTVAPVNYDPIDYFVEKSYSDLAGQYEEVLKALFPTSEKVKAEPVSEETSLVQAITKAMDSDIITWDRKKMSFVIEFNGEQITLGKSATAIEKNIKENKDLIAFISK